MLPAIDLGPLIMSLGVVVVFGVVVLLCVLALLARKVLGFLGKDEHWDWW